MNEQNNKNRKPWSVRISTGCILYIIFMVCLFWFCIRTINKCTYVHDEQPTVIHDTIYIDKNNTQWVDTLNLNMKRAK